jgi:two-component system response regulator AtoC
MEKILIVDDDIAIVESLRFALKDVYDLYIAYNSADAWELYNNNDIAVTILDLKIGSDDGMEMYRRISEINSHAVVIIITAFGTIKSTIEAIKSGIFYYLVKPIDLKELELLISKGVEMNSLYRQISRLNEESRQKYCDHGIIAKSSVMKSVLNTVDKVKDINSNILFTGESGTGKGLIARAIHDFGNRKNEKFNVINCAAIPSNLIESELFGYKKGAFTGANADKRGCFELSNKGTLFLDEIGDMDFNLQGKLLMAIQDKTITPVGSEENIKVDVRIIAATNKDLFSQVAAGLFREDLFYRLNVINIHMPALRERKEDIPYLINYFVYKYSRILDKRIDKIESNFVDILENYDYNGNIRELENLIERAIALSEDDTLSKKDIISNINKDEANNIMYNKKLIPVFVGDTMESIEKKVIMTTYETCGFNKQETSQLLGITDRTVRNKLKQYKDQER